MRMVVTSVTVRRVAHCRRSGFTLVELVVSMAASTVLMAGMGSAIFIAARASNPSEVPANTIKGSVTAQEIAAELRSAVSFNERTANSVEFTVADRDGDGFVETIRYNWSAVPGHPLTRQYNGGNVVNVLEDVYDFSLAYFGQPTQDVPRVLLIVPDATNLSSQDSARKATIESWGYPLDLKSASDSQASYNTAVTTAYVAYISEEVVFSQLNTKIKQSPIGVVNEVRQLLVDFEMSSGTGSWFYDNEIHITDNTHEITSVFPLGLLTICASNQELGRTNSTLGGGVEVLAKKPNSSYATLVVVEYGGALLDGSSAAARRVKVPWGGNLFDFNTLTNDGLTLMQRAIDWAAGPDLLTRVRVALQAGQDSTSRVETETEILNQPRTLLP